MTGTKAIQHLAPDKRVRSRRLPSIFMHFYEQTLLGTKSAASDGITCEQRYKLVLAITEIRRITVLHTSIIQEEKARETQERDFLAKTEEG